MERLTTADGRTLAYHRSGSGPTLVCHPGGPGFSSLYLGDLAGVDRELELVLLDPRGTGAIALAIADEVPGAQVIAMDVSEEALALARENLELTGINGRVRLVEHDLTSGLGEHDFDLVVSNPPYVEPEELPTLQPEVRDWEPHVALVASGATEKLALAAREALRPGGWLVLETAAGAGDRVERLLAELGFEQVTITPDLAGRDRVVEGRWRS